MDFHAFNQRLMQMSLKVKYFDLNSMQGKSTAQFVIKLAMAYCFALRYCEVTDATFTLMKLDGLESGTQPSDAS